MCEKSFAHSSRLCFRKVILMPFATYSFRSHMKRVATLHWEEAVSIAAASLWAHKLRSVLTLIGVVIGVAAVIHAGTASPAVRCERRFCP